MAFEYGFLGRSNGGYPQDALAGLVRFLREKVPSASFGEALGKLGG